MQFSDAMSVRDRIAELQTEIVNLRLMIEREKDAELRNLAKELMEKLSARVDGLKKYGR